MVETDHQYWKALSFHQILSDWLPRADLDASTVTKKSFFSSKELATQGTFFHSSCVPSHSIESLYHI